MLAQISPASLRNGELERPVLHLSGPKLVLALEMLVSRADEHGGVERYVDAVKLKSRMFQEALAERDGFDLAVFKTLCAHMSTVRRRMSAYLEPAAFADVRDAVFGLLDGLEDTTTADARVAAFCARFPADRDHRWVRDLAAEILHNVDPGRYPLMARWVWDRQANTGVLREVWHAENIDNITIEIPDRYGTFVMLREELAQFLSGNGVFRDVMEYIDVLTAQLYANYICEQGGAYLRTDFSSPDDPMLYLRRLLGVDGVTAAGRTRLKSADGRAFVVEELKLPN